jgi:hypothetical protein
VGGGYNHTSQAVDRTRAAGWESFDKLRMSGGMGNLRDKQRMMRGRSGWEKITYEGEELWLSPGFS